MIAWAELTKLAQDRRLGVDTHPGSLADRVRMSTMFASAETLLVIRSSAAWMSSREPNMSRSRSATLIPP
jgi:hypothetical protein